MTYKSNVGTAVSCSAKITRKKNRIKSYGDPSSTEPLKHFLKNGEEFEIELFNPHTVQVLSKIKINGIPISSSGIVLMPGQRVFLERFIDTNEKFVFKTYVVGDSKEVKDAIANNGDITVEFFHESIKTQNFIKTIWPTTYTIHNYPIYNPTFVGSPLNDPFNIPYGSTLTNGTFTIGANLGGTISNCVYSSANLGNSSTLNDANSNPTYKEFLDEVVKDFIETGRVSGGTASSQTFETVYGDFNIFPSKMVSMKIFPESQKPIEASEIRSYCPSCKIRIKKTSWKFCPSCGEDLS